MAEKGYQATTIADIARAARVSKTVVYAHFRDKEQCLLELYSRANDKVLATVRQAQDDARAAGCRGGTGCAPASAPTSRRSPPARPSPGRPSSRCRPPAAPALALRRD